MDTYDFIPKLVGWGVRYVYNQKDHLNIIYRDCDIGMRRKMCDKPLDFNDFEKVGGHEGLGVKLLIGRFLEEGLIKFIQMELNNSQRGDDYLVGSGQVPRKNKNTKQCDLIVVEKRTDEYYHCKIGNIIIPYQPDIIRLILWRHYGVGFYKFKSVPMTDYITK